MSDKNISINARIEYLNLKKQEAKFFISDEKFPIPTKVLQLLLTRYQNELDWLEQLKEKIFNHRINGDEDCYRFVNILINELLGKSEESNNE